MIKLQMFNGMGLISVTVKEIDIRSNLRWLMGICLVGSFSQCISVLYRIV